MRSCVGSFDAGAGAGAGLVAFEDFALVDRFESKVASKSLRMESIHSSTNSANSTRRVGVSRTELSEAPSSLLAFPESASGLEPVTRENILRD
jgi:hypothetical protein